MSGRLGPGGGTGVVRTAGEAGGTFGGVGVVAVGAADGAGAGATGGSAEGADGRCAPAGTGGAEPAGIVGGTMGVATSAGGIGVVVGNGAGSRGLCESGVGMMATPDGMDGRLDGSSNFGVSCVGCVSWTPGLFACGGKKVIGCEPAPALGPRSCCAAAGAMIARARTIAARRTAADLTSASAPPVAVAARAPGAGGYCGPPCRPVPGWRRTDRSATCRRYQAGGRPS